MKFPWLFVAAVVEAAAVTRECTVDSPDEDGRYAISSTNITAQFIPYGATMTNLFVKDKHGKDINVVLGYDDVDYYPKDPDHPVYNAIPGHYANRIGKGKSTIDGVTYKTEKNDGDNTLHSGTNNWSFRFWNGQDNGQIARSKDSHPPHSTYLLQPRCLRQPRHLQILVSPAPPSVLLSLPTGRILTAASGSINDFHSAPNLTLGHAQEQPGFSGNCGAGGRCEGYNWYWLIEDAPPGVVVARLASEFSRVRAELRTDQPGLVVYSCNWADGSAKLKRTQGADGKEGTVGRSSCVAIEAQEWVAGVNQ
ncbi:hypothetical protein VTI74DRAFT_4241 [Chaetomium olivicolor]